MKRQLATLLLCAMAIATLPMPARADFNVSFGRFDRNHDGRWNYREFNDANQYYYRNHPGVQIMSRRQMRDEFNRLDTDNDGYINEQVAQTYRTWD